jgi:hypothetical protein
MTSVKIIVFRRAAGEKNVYFYTSEREKSATWSNSEAILASVEMINFLHASEANVTLILRKFWRVFD